MVHSHAADPGAELRTREHSTGGEPTSLWTHVCITVRFIWGRVADAQVVPVVAPGPGAAWIAREVLVLHLSVGFTDNPPALCA